MFWNFLKILSENYYYYIMYIFEKFIPENDYNVDVIERLLSGGAKLDARTAWGDTAVHYAGNCV